jgi:MFS family permease
MKPSASEWGVQAGETEISSKLTLISAFVVHAVVEIPYFIFPVIVLVVGQDLNLGELKWIGLGALGTLSTLAAGLPAPIFGWLADKYRRGVLMVGSLLCAFFGGIIIGFFGSTYVMLAIAMILFGLGNALYHPAGLSWIASAYSTADGNSYSPYFNRILGVHGVGGTIGSATAPLIVYFLVDIIHWRHIYFISGLPAIIVAIGFWFFIGRNESRTISQQVHGLSTQEIEPIGNWVKNQKNRRISRAVGLIFIFMFLFAFAFGMISFILAAFLAEIKGFQIAEAGLFIGVTHLLGASGQLLGGVMGDRYGEKWALSIATGLQIVVMIGIYTLTAPIGLFIVYILTRSANAVFWPVTNSFLAKHAKRKGSAFGGFMFTVNVVRALGPGIDGILLTYDPQKYFLIFLMAILLFCGALVTLMLLKETKNKTTSTILMQDSGSAMDSQ